MRFGAVLPTRDLPVNGPSLRAWAEAIEELGVDHISVPDHVLGVRPEDQEPGWDRDWPHPDAHRVAYTHLSPFRETFVTMGFLAACCGLEMTSGVLVLPQRNTALVAKQAAEVDVLTGGRLRLGVGVGWNAGEYRSIGAPFSDRGRRLEEQITLLRRFWTEDTVSFRGDFHSVVSAGIAPMPVQRPIPVWLGGGSIGRSGSNERVLARIGRLADGWYVDSRTRPGAEALAAIYVVHRAAADAGRDPARIGVDVRLLLKNTALNEVTDLVTAWARMGATHVTVDTSDVGLAGIREHAEALASVLHRGRSAAGSR